MEEKSVALIGMVRYNRLSFVGNLADKFELLNGHLGTRPSAKRIKNMSGQG